MASTMNTNVEDDNNETVEACQFLGDWGKLTYSVYYLYYICQFEFTKLQKPTQILEVKGLIFVKKRKKEKNSYKINLSISGTYVKS